MGTTIVESFQEFGGSTKKAARTTEDDTRTDPQTTVVRLFESTTTRFQRQDGAEQGIRVHCVWNDARRLHMPHLQEAFLPPPFDHVNETRIHRTQMRC